MDIVVTAAVLGAALLHAIWNALVKTGEDKLISITGVAAGAALSVVLFLPFVAVPDRASWPFIFASVLLHAGYMIALRQAYRFSDFSSAYPIARGTAPILVFAWSVVFLQEALSAREMLAVMGIVVGILVFSTRRLDKVVNDQKALFYALLTAVFIAAYTLVDGVGVRLSGTVSGYLGWSTIFEIIPMLAYTYARRGPSLFPALIYNRKMFFLAGLMAVGGYWIIVWAMSQAPIALVAALRETSIVIAALIGAYYFKEPSGGRRIIAAGIICISVLVLRW